MKLLSDACEYGLRAVVWLAQRPGGTGKVREISEGTRAAPGYLVKVLQSLARARILSAQRGSHGGFRLERDPSSLTVLEILEAIDPLERIHSCPLGIESHGVNLCPMHRQLDDAMAMIERNFAETTIGVLLTVSAKSRLCDALTPLTSADGEEQAANHGE